MWSSETVKQELPDVKVIISFQGKEYTVPATLHGRKNQFATVCWRDGHAEWSWAAIAYSLNSGNALKAVSQ
jgi:hypothetical protein